MKTRGLSIRRLAGLALACGIVLGWGVSLRAQSKTYERTFAQSKAAIEKALKEMQPAASGRLPVLEGFAASSEHPLDQYRRGFYQAKFEVRSTAAGGCVVRVSVQVTAWLNDATGSKSGYQALASNGRLEGDLLDQLAEQVAGGSAPSPGITAGSEHKPFPAEKSPESAAADFSASVAPRTKAPAKIAKSESAPEATPSAPLPQIPETGRLSAPLSQGLSETASNSPRVADSDKDASLRAEAQSLEEILRNQAHPKNLVAVKKSGTPVVGSASLSAKTLFLASAHDEFEMLDFNRDWVHVRISGLSRGWIWRNNLEMPDSVPDADVATGPAPGPVAAELFHVTREETAPFPGDWAPLRGKSVKIVSVEKINEAKEAGPRLRLEFAKSVLEKEYGDVAKDPKQLAGIVLIFDSVDGGMVAATLDSLQQWKGGTLSDAALWHRCFFDPPETFNESAASGTQ